jgi:hypothetical protein
VEWNPTSENDAANYLRGAVKNLVLDARRVG